MPPRRTPRLAYCEYVIPDPKGSSSVWMARLDLMGAVKRIYPTMLERLSADVFPSYEELAQAGFDFDHILWSSGVLPHTMLPENGEPQIQVEKRTGKITLAHYNTRLKSALAQWANKFNAGTNWFLDETLRTLRGWYVAPEWRDSLKWNPIGGVTSTLAMGKRFRFDCEGWEMQHLTWAAYSKSVRERFEQQLAEYEAASRTLAESKGLVRAPQKYSPSNFDWFVLYQFQGLSSTEIADRCSQENESDIDPSSVLKGVKAAAKLVAWDCLRVRHGKRNRKIRWAPNLPLLHSHPALQQTPTRPKYRSGAIRRHELAGQQLTNSHRVPVVRYQDSGCTPWSICSIPPKGGATEDGPLRSSRVEIASLSSFRFRPLVGRKRLPWRSPSSKAVMNVEHFHQRHSALLPCPAASR